MFLSDQSDSGLQVAVTLVVCDYYFTVLLRAEPLSYYQSRRKCKLRGLFHYMFDVRAAREKAGKVRLGIYSELKPLLRITELRELFGEYFKHGAISFYCPLSSQNNLVYCGAFL